MGNVFSRHRHREEREMMHGQIAQLSLTLQALQKEMDTVKYKADNTARQLSTSERDLLRENMNSSQKLNDVTEQFTRLANKLENDLQDLKIKVNETRKSHGQDMKNVFHQIEKQDVRNNELLKTAKDWEDSFVSLKEFSALKTAVNAIKQAMEQEKDEFVPSVRKLIKEKSSQWDKEFLDMMDRYQETRASVMELIALNLGHERDITGLKFSLSKLEDKIEPNYADEILPEPSLPDIDGLKAVQSEASSVLKPIEPVAIDEEDYRLRFSKISCVMKRINEEMNWQ